MSGVSPPDADAARARLVAGIRSGSLFLLILSMAMLPVVTGTADLSLRLLALALGIAGALFWALAMIFEGRFMLPRAALVAAGALALGVAAISGALSDCPQAAIVTLVLWVGYAAGFLLAVWTGSSERIRCLLVRTLCAVAVSVAAFAIPQYTVLLDLTREQVEADPAAALRKTGLTEQDYHALIQRLKSKRVFSTFTLPNSLAGFLLIAIPPGIALAVSARRRLRRVVLCGAVGLLLLGLFLTFSKGGWLAGFVVLILFLATRGRHWLRRHWMPAASAACFAAAVLAASLSLSPALRARMAAMSRELGKTARVRTQYWSAGFSMWRRSPLVGVGPGNFKNHYMGHKAVTAEETKSAHNDYVQVLAECGPIALAGYVAFWALLLWGALRRKPRAEPPATAPRGSRGTVLVAAAALAGFAAAGFFGRAFSVTTHTYVDVAVFALFAALWLLVYWASNKLDEGPGTHRALQAGLCFGLLGFVLHSCVDFHLYVDGVGYIAFIAAGLAAAPWIRTKIVHLEGGRRAAALIPVVLIGLGVLFVVSRVSEGDSYRVLARSMVRRSRALAEQAVGSSAHSPAQAQRDMARARQFLSEAHDALERSRRANPLDHRTAAEMANCSQTRFSMDPDTLNLKQAAEAWRRAIRLNPSFPDYRAHLARLFRMMAGSSRFLVKDHLPEYRALAAKLSLARPAAEELVPALVESYLATQLAPNKPQYRLLYGETLRLARLPRDAREQFENALDLDKRMRAGGAPHRQWLTKDQVESLKTKLGLTGSGGGAIIRK